MKRSGFVVSGRREFLRVAGVSGVALALGGLSGPLFAQGVSPIRIGIVGAGRVGGTLAEFWAKAGHDVLVSSLDAEADRVLAAKIGARARAGSSSEAVQFGDAVLVSVPYAALPKIGQDLGDVLRGKVVLDTCNPIPGRDGDMAKDALAKGTGAVSPVLLPGTRLVRAFNCVGVGTLRSEAHRAGEKVGIPLAADDAGALAVAERLVRDAGFEPVVLGGLARAKEFDYGTPVFGRGRTPTELRAMFKLC